MKQTRWAWTAMLLAAACGTTSGATDSDAGPDGLVAIDIQKPDVAKDGTVTAEDAQTDTSGAADTGTDSAAPDSAASDASLGDATSLDGSGDSESNPDTQADVAALTCGDGLCTAPETNATCSADCAPAVCGNGWCQKPESGVTCEVDCSPTAVAQVACMKTTCATAVQNCLANKGCAKTLGPALQCIAQTGADADFCQTALLLDALGKPLTAAACNFVACAASPGAPVCGDNACQAAESQKTCPYDCSGPWTP